MPHCRMCLQDKKLCQSHAIPDAIFKSISRKSNGKLIAIPEGDGNIHYTSETGKAALFCKECEQFFNDHFDRYFVKTLRLLENEFIRVGSRARVNCDIERFFRAFASIIWRAGVSTNRIYADVDLKQEHLHLLNTIMLSETAATKLMSMRLHRIVDPIPVAEGGVAPETMSNAIFPIKAYYTSLKKKPSKRYVSFDLVVQGFLLHAFLPKLPFSKNREPGFVKPSAGYLHAIQLDMFKYPPIRDAVVDAYGKRLEAHMSQSLKKQKGESA